MPARVEIPRLRTMARHALPHLMEATVVPLILFYAFLWSVGVWGALLAALVWPYAAVLRRFVTGQRIPRILILGTLSTTAPPMYAFAIQIVVLYLLQTTLSSIAIGDVFPLALPVIQ